MKKNILALLFSILAIPVSYCKSKLVSTSEAPASNSKSMIIRIGVEGAVNLANYSCSNTSQANSNSFFREKPTGSKIFDYRLGLKFETKLHKLLYLQTAVLCTKRRFLRDFTQIYFGHAYPNGPDESVYNYDVRSVEIPFYFTFKTPNISTGRLMFGLGPYLCFNTRASLTCIIHKPIDEHLSMHVSASFESFFLEEFNQVAALA